jgi:Flp pilus assembly protein TadG
MAVVEFALCLPFLALLYLGSYQLMDALACNRKVTVTTRAIADLTSQYSTLGTADADQILSASAQILAPYNAANALFRVSQLYTDKNGTTTVMWSRAKNGSALVSGATVTPPAAILVNDNYLIYAEVSYTYTPIARYGLLAPIALADTVYMSPRVSSSVKLQ